MCRAVGSERQWAARSRLFRAHSTAAGPRQRHVGARPYGTGVAHRVGMHVTTDSAKRVPEHTPTDVNLAIAERTKQSIAYFDDHREHIPRRLGELDREWDVERMLALGSSCLSLAGLALARSGRRRWLWLPLVVQGSY